MWPMWQELQVFQPSIIQAPNKSAKIKKSLKFRKKSSSDNLIMSTNLLKKDHDKVLTNTYML